jgi:hypothetical protein
VPAPPRARSFIRRARPERTDESFDERAHQRRGGETHVLLGHPACAHGDGETSFEFGDERLAIGEPQRVDFGIDRLGDHRPGEAALMKRAGGESGDGSCECRERARRRIGC